MIDATVSGAASNSYVAAAEAEAYFALRLNGADWLAIGTVQVETATVAGTIGASGAGNAAVIVTADGMTPVTLNVAVANNDTASLVAGKIRAALALDATVTAFFAVSGTGPDVIVTALLPTFNDSTMNLSIDNGTCTGLTAALTSVNTTAGTGEREIALIQATQQLELFRYVGVKTVDTQALKWPRKNVFDENGVEYDNDSIPFLIQQACYELALALLINPSLGTDTGLEMFSDIQIERDTRFTLRQGADSPYPSQVMRPLRGFIASTAGATTFRA